MTKKIIGAIFFAALSSTTFAANSHGPASWFKPVAPFRIIDNIYYVGTEGLASYLIVSSQGAILLDATTEENVPQIERNIEKLGFKVSDVKILLNSHAHWDHSGGLAKFKADSGAKLMASNPDIPALEAGQHEDGNENGATKMTPVKVDQVIADGEKIRLGNILLTATLTPGHTQGCTTWSMTATVKQKPLAVIFPCSISVAGNYLVDNDANPDIVAEYRKSFDRLAGMKADIVLTFHPELNDLHGRHANGDAFVDTAALGRIVADARKAFDEELKKQAAKP